jgi:hypothetical protein
MPHDRKQASADWLELVREKVQSLQFGVIQIVVQTADGLAIKEAFDFDYHLRVWTRLTSRRRHFDDS